MIAAGPSAAAEGIGRRIQILGNSCAGKSTLGAELSRSLGLPLVELDALNWLPGWVGLNETDPQEFERRIREATAGDAWVVAGSYAAFTRRAFWDRLETVIWLDLPMSLLLARVLARSWRRWRTKELLWGTNYESFFDHFKLWRGDDSLIWWIVTQHARKRRSMLRLQSAPEWSHIRFIRLRSLAEIREFASTARV
ncbi:MAG TPA: adenylate kinase [Candidatus Kapabacteria bacterium]|nr:adenylate kinase [Candidatus Kapabacteria bacterium]